MYKKLDYLRIPSEEAKVWRYISLAKFISLLDTQSLYFSSLNKLSSVDRFEGLYPNFDDNSFLPDANISSVIGNARKFTKNYRKHFFVNCWHLNDNECDGMWKIYGGSEPAIAIQTNIKKLKDSFDNCQEDIFIGKVEYDDNPRITTRIPTCFYKRTAFSFERELRIGFEKIPKNEEGKFDVNCEPQKCGYSINVDAKTLIERIIVSPTASSWFYNIVKSITTKYNLSEYIIAYSKLKNRPY